MKAIWICANAKKLIEERKEVVGLVHSIFNRTCNIITGDDILISLISSQIPIAPRSISLHLPEDRDLYSFELEKGMGFVINENMIAIGRNGFTIDLAQSKVWNPGPILDFKGVSEDIVLKNIESFKETLLEKGNFNGIAPIFLDISNYLKDDHGIAKKPQTNHYCTFIQAKMQKLIELLMEENIEGIGVMAKQIIGFGPGLTPSTDDFLAGLMVSMLYCRKYYQLNLSDVYQINKILVNGAVGRTTKVSSEMLQFASRGQVAEHIRNLMVNIFSVEDAKQIIKNTCTVIETGETSGSDLAAGIYIGFILTLYNRRGRKELKCI